MSASETARVPNRRNVELALLVVVALVFYVFLVAVEIAQTGDVQTSGLVMTLTFAVALGVGHLLIRFFAPYADPVLYPCAAMITGIGIVFIRRLDMSDPDQDFFATQADRASMGVLDGAGGRQLLFFIGCNVVLGLFLWWFKDHRSFARYPYIVGLVGLLLAASPAVLGEVRYGSKLWINLGFISVQPSEFAKLLLLIFFAYYLVRKREVLSLASKKFLGLQWPRLRDLLPVLVVWLVSLVIMVGLRDLGTSLLFFGMFVAVLYIATQRVSWIVLGLSMFALGAAIMYPLFDHLQRRVYIWLDPFADPTDKGFQIVQSLIGLGSGGLFGAGPGAGQPQSVGFAANSDFIIVGLGEELGLFGLVTILLMYLLFVVRGLRTALTVRDSFGKLLAGGLAFSLGFQVFVIVGGVTKLIPLTGQTAPLLSAGGSSLIANWILVTLLIRVSDSARKPQPVPQGPIKVAPPPKPADNSPTELVSIPHNAADETEVISGAEVEKQASQGSAETPQADKDDPTNPPEVKP
ncbi:MAG TPA: FtsW/RodA/SpoVE family cell cycle protein [Candidatus Stackebrandtia faecavium]|nr:FtsW/RodA/SpoVE family cell cycle protein [Candidatus Stackebrandtia faecavium]